MASRTRYWSCSKFADWLRGTPKLAAGTSKEWRDWRKDASTKHPFRYWVAEEALDNIQSFIWYPVDKIHNVKYYINNRWVTRTHSLTSAPTSIKRGQWRDLGDRILPCLFDELVNFVEVELAWKNVAWDKEAREKYNVPFWGTGWFRWRTWRSPAAGLDHLNWEINLVADETWGLEPGDKGYGEPVSQSQRAKTVLELYNWYKNVYKNRPDPHDASGWTEYCNRRRDDDQDFFGLEDRSDEERAEANSILDLCRKIEEQYQTEDTEMLIKLINIRDHLWT